MGPAPWSVPPPPSRSDLGWGIAIGVAVTLVAAGAVLAVNRVPSCAGCPALFPVGAVLTIGTGTGACAAGNGTTYADCAYTFPLRVAAMSPALTARDLSFQIQNAGDSAIPAPFTVTLTAAAGCGVAAWSSLNGTWGPPTVNGSCGDGAGPTTPLATGESLVLTPIPRGGLPFSVPGYHLVAVGSGPSFTGETGGAIA